MQAAMNHLIKDHRAIGKEQMKQVAVVAQEVKNDSMRKGGFAPSQWVLGKYPDALVPRRRRTSGASSECSKHRRTHEQPLADGRRCGSRPRKHLSAWIAVTAMLRQ